MQEDEDCEIENAEPSDEEPSKEEHGNSNVCPYCCEEFPHDDLLRDHLGEHDDGEGTGQPKRHYYSVEETIYEAHEEEKSGQPESHYHPAEETIQEAHEEETTGQPETRQDPGEQTFFECVGCSGLFRLLGDLKLHIRDIHTNKYRCHICGTSFPENQLLEEHIEKDHNSSQKCDVCGVEKDSELDMKFHRFDHRFACMFCRLVFTTPADIYSHIVKVHDDKEFKMKGYILCPICISQARFRYLQEFVAHCQLRHEEVYPFYCDYCGQVFQMRDELHNHLRIHEPDVRKRKYSGTEDSESTSKKTEQCDRNLSTCSTAPLEVSSESPTEFSPDEGAGFEDSEAAMVSTPIPSHRSSVAPEHSVANLQGFHTSTRPHSVTVTRSVSPTVTRPKTHEYTTSAFSPPIFVSASSEAKRLTSLAVPKSGSPKRNLTYPPSSSSSAKRPGASTAPAAGSKTASVSSSAGRPSSSMERDITRREQLPLPPTKSSPVPPSPAKSAHRSTSRIPSARSETPRAVERSLRSYTLPGRCSGTERQPLEEKKPGGSSNFYYCSRCHYWLEKKNEKDHVCAVPKIQCLKCSSKFMTKEEMWNHLHEYHSCCPEHPDVECESKEELSDHIRNH